MLLLLWRMCRCAEGCGGFEKSAIGDMAGLNKHNQLYFRINEIDVIIIGIICLTC